MERRSLPSSRGDRDDVLLEELAEEDENSGADREGDAPVDERPGAARVEGPGNARAEQLVRQERVAGDERSEPDDDVARRSEPLERVEDRLRRDASPRAEVGAEEDAEDRPGDDDAALEAAAGRDEAERDQPEPHEKRCAGEDDPHDAHGVAADAFPDFLVAFLRPQEKRHASDGTEEDELLAHRVETAIVEDDGRDDVRHVSLRQRHVVQEVAVRADVVPEVGQAYDGPDEKRAEDGERREEYEDACTTAHLFLDRVTATSRMTGYPTQLTTSIDSATSGADSTKKSKVRSQP